MSPSPVGGMISTDALATVTRLSILKQKIQLADAQKEVQTGRKSDVGMDLGGMTSRTLLLRQELARLDTTVTNNGLVSTRLDTSQKTLTSVHDDGNTFLGTLLSARGNPAQASLLESSAKGYVNSFETALNTSVGGEYLFGGINTDVKPVPGGLGDASSAGRQAIEAAFTAYFGFSSSNSTAVSAIAPSDMQNFLSTTFGDLFKDPSWGQTFSNASDQPVKNRISGQELVQTSVTANAQGFRDMTQAYAMVTSLGISGLNAQTFDVVIDQATKLMGNGTKQVVQMQGQLGLVQEQIKNANDRMGIQKGLLTDSISALENVDPYDATTRINNLLNQIEASYKITATIQKLNLFDYI